MPAAALSVFGLVLAAFTFAASMDLQRVGGGGVDAGGPLVLAESLGMAATNALTASVQSPATSHALIVKAKAETEAQLRLAPSSAVAWVRLASISAETGSPDVLRQVENSYRADPVDLRIAPFRVRLVLERWKLAPSSLHAEALNEVQVICTTPNSQGCSTLRLLLAPLAQSLAS